MEPWLQEDITDAFERVSADPSRLRVNAGGFAIHDFERTGAGASGTSHVVFLRLHRDDARRVLSVLGIADHVRLRTQAPPPDGLTS